MGKGGMLAIAIGVTCALFLPRERAPAEPRMQVAANAPEEIRLRARGDGHFYLHAMVNGQIVEFVVDTGATRVVLTADDAERVGLPVDPKRFEIIGSGASGAVRGQHVRLASIEYDGRTMTSLEASVADGLEQSLLGQDFLRGFESVSMSGSYMVLR